MSSLSGAKYDRLVVKNFAKPPTASGSSSPRAAAAMTVRLSKWLSQFSFSAFQRFSRDTRRRATFNPRISIVFSTLEVPMPWALHASVSALIRPSKCTLVSDCSAGNVLGSMKSASTLSSLRLSAAHIVRYGRQELFGVVRQLCPAETANDQVGVVQFTGGAVFRVVAWNDVLDLPCVFPKTVDLTIAAKPMLSVRQGLEKLSVAARIPAKMLPAYLPASVIKIIAQQGRGPIQLPNALHRDSRMLSSSFRRRISMSALSSAGSFGERSSSSRLSDSASSDSPRPSPTRSM